MLKAYLLPAVRQAFADGGTAVMQDICDSLTLEQLQKVRTYVDAAIARKKNEVSITVKGP
jgi:hypothetical protein